MTAYNGSLSVIPRLQNNLIAVQATNGSQALANTDTLDITLPTGMDGNFAPVAIQAYTKSGNVYTPAGNYALTNHDSSTKKTRLTASGAVAANTIFQILYAAVS